MMKGTGMHSSILPKWISYAALAQILCSGQACYDRGLIIKGDAGTADSPDHDVLEVAPDQNIDPGDPDAVPPGETWIMTLGGTVFDNLDSAAESADGGLVMVGETGSFEGCGLWIVKADREGRIVWQRIMVNDNSCQGDVIVPSREGGFVVAGSISPELYEWDMFLLRISEDGTPLWPNAVKLPQDYTTALVELADGSLLAGGFLKDADEENGYLTLTGLDASGNVLWQRGIRAVYGEAFMRTAALPDGSVLVAVKTSRDQETILTVLDAAGNVLWSKGSELSIQSVATLPDGGIAALAYWSDGMLGNHGILVAKLDGEGNSLWQRTWSSLPMIEPRGVTLGDDSSIVLLIDEDTGPDFSTIGLMGIDEAGGLLWHRTINSGMADYGWSLLKMADGDLAVVGKSGTLFFNLYHDAFIARLDAEGRVRGNCGILEDQETVLENEDVPFHAAEIMLEESTAAAEALPVAFVDTPAVPEVFCPE